MATDYNLLGSTEVLEELKEGRTRELLLLLQDKPVPEVQDPLNIQSALSSNFKTDNDGDYIMIDSRTVEIINDFEDDNIDTKSSNWGNWDVGTGAFEAQNYVTISGSYTAEYSITDSSGSFKVQRTAGATSELSRVQFDIVLNESYRTNTDVSLKIEFSGGRLDEVVWNGSQEIIVGGTNTGVTWNSDQQYHFEAVIDSSKGKYSILWDGEIIHESTTSLSDLEGLDFYSDALDGGTWNVYLDNIIADDGSDSDLTTGYVTDSFSSPTTEPVDFKQWNSIQARDVTTGGSTSADPVEFEIFDSTNTALNSTRISKARIADEPFTMRNRVYSESAGSDGQNDYQIATTGDGGHFGIPVLTVVSVKKNGSVLDSANWSFDGTDTVTIDTSSVTIASGDTIDIKYDFDVFDSTLQPRAYLSREDSSETSPSISHFRYEYVI